MNPSFWYRTTLFATIFAASAMAQNPKPAPSSELIERTKQLAVIAAQKAEADARLALREAAVLAKTNAAEAAQNLKAALAAVEGETHLAADRKATLARVIRDQIRVIEGGPESAEDAAARQKAEEARLAAIKAAAEKQKAETTAVKKGLEDAAKLQKDGKTAEAEKIVTKLGNDYPQNLAVMLVTGNYAMEKALAGDQDVKKATARAHVNAMRDVGETGVPVDNNIQFPKDWNERTKDRRDAAAPTPEERKLIQVLERPIDVRYKASRFQDVMDHLAETMGRTIMIDPTALTEAGVAYDSPVNFSVREPVAARTALRSILAPLNLTYVVRDNIIHVTTPSRAKDLMITKVYYLGDLITGLGPMGGAPTIGFNLDQIQVVQNVTAIVEMIRNAVDPLSWDTKGGQGSVGVNLQTMSIIVRQSQEVHALIRGSLYGSTLPAPAPK